MDRVIRYLDTSLLAQRLGTTPHKVRLMRSRGILPAPDAMLGTRPLWRVESIDFWLSRHPDID